MKFLKSNANIILLCLLEALVGVLLLVDPIGFTSAIVIALGVALLIGGLVAVVTYFRADAVEAALSRTLAKGLALLLTGAFCVLQPAWLIDVFPRLTILYGIFTLLAGLSRAQWAIDALRLKTGRWLFPAVSAAVSISCAVVVLANPFLSTLALWMFTGIALIVNAVLDVLVLLVNQRGVSAGL